MSNNISPRIDLAFKKIFGVEENKDLLISLINAIVSEADQVADLTLLNPYNVQNFRNDKLSVLDIKAKGVDGSYFNIEIQITDEGDYDKRALYYWAKLYTEQLKYGDPYRDLCKVIGIHILNFFSIPKSEAAHNVFHITEKQAGFPYFENLELHTIELKKFQGLECKQQSELVSKIKTALDVWMAFLTRHELLDPKSLPNTLPQKAQLNKALNVLEVMNLSSEERDSYEDRMKWFRDEEAALFKAEKKGERRGEKQGIKKVAKNLLAAGIDIKVIAASTGLTIEEIKALK